MARYRGAFTLCLIQFAYWSGVNAVMPLVSIYTIDILGATTGQAQGLPALMLAGTTLLAIPMGKLGDRFGKRRVISRGYSIMGCAALGGLVITSIEQGMAVFLLAGIGNAAIVVLNIPLLTELVPRHHMGTASGFLAASGSLAAPIASLAAGGLADAFGPRAIFGLMAATIAIALSLMPGVRPPAETRSTSILE
jgi:MFS family permease